jgi:hypothetical protein
MSNSFYTYLLEKEMMINIENKNGLKGQYNLAQGNPEASGRPGF